MRAWHRPEWRWGATERRLLCQLMAPFVNGAARLNNFFSLLWEFILSLCCFLVRVIFTATHVVHVVAQVIVNHLHNDLGKTVNPLLVFWLLRPFIETYYLGQFGPSSHAVCMCHRPVLSYLHRYLTVWVLTPCSSWLISDVGVLSPLPNGNCTDVLCLLLPTLKHNLAFGSVLFC